MDRLLARSLTPHLALQLAPVLRQPRLNSRLWPQCEKHPRACQAPPKGALVRFSRRRCLRSAHRAAGGGETSSMSAMA
jgi:hypothetical protein